MPYNVIVSYDLNNEKDYETIKSYLDNLSGRKILTTTWLIDTDKSIDTIISELKDLVDDDDKVFVASMSDYKSKGITFNKTSIYGELFD